MSKDKGRIEGMNEKLYSRTRYVAPGDAREPISQVESETAREDWGTPGLDELLLADRKALEQHPVLKKIFLVAVLFFVCAMGAATLIYFNGNNFISTRNLDIAINAPVNISAASPVDLEITITNKNNAALNEVTLNILYPNGTRNPIDGSTILSEEEEDIEKIAPGERVTRNEQAIFLGSAGEVKTVKVSVTYKVEGSNATFTKEKIFELTIGSAPVSVSVVRPETITSGEVFTTTVSIAANSEEVLRGVTLRAEYPYGWSLSSSVPEASNISKNEWSLGNLSPGSTKTVTLKGIVLGEDNEERTFRFFVESGDGEGTLLSSDSMVVLVRRPSLDVSVRLNGDTNEEYIAPAGRPIQANITLKNNLPENLISPEVEVRLLGTALDKLSVSAQGGGSYSSSRGTIIWNNSNNSELNTIAPGETRNISFSFASLSNLAQGTSNQKIDAVISFSGRPQNSSATVKVSETRTIKIASEVSLSSRSLYSRGPFKNTGPIPPKAEEETTYTIGMTLGNTQNDVKDGRVMATLGANVIWAGEIFGEGVNVTYDESSRMITWQVDELVSGAGFSSPAKEVFFKVGLTPSLGQVGGAPVLLNNIAFVGTDSFTNTEVRVVNPSVTTRTTLDPNYVQGDEIVVK